MAAAWLSLLLPSMRGVLRGLVRRGARGCDYLAASPSAQDQSARNRRLTTVEGVCGLVGDSYREKERECERRVELGENDR